MRGLQPISRKESKRSIKTAKMQKALLIFLFDVLMMATATPSGMATLAASAYRPMTRPQTLRDIIFPKESFDECFMDDKQRVPGQCKRLEDCPDALRLWSNQQLTPKTCYFIKFDQYVCCGQNNSSAGNKTAPLILEQGNDCENSPLRPAVVGGRPTANGEFPFMAALGWRFNFDGSIYYRCGGSLISPTFVLTAAHCINFDGQYPATVRLGGSNLTEGMGEDHMIRRVFVHPDYNESGTYNDIALLELEQSKPSTLKVACLWQQAQLPVKELTAIGYGQVRFAGLPSSQLLKVDLQHISSKQCQPHYTRILDEGVADSQLCAGDLNGKGDTCQGDSGGPLLMRMRWNWFLVGITSLGQGCASGPPSIYTRVSSYLDWIESIVWPKANVNSQQPTFDLRISH